MTDYATDPTIARIRALLKHAESAAKVGNQHEADIYNDKAAKLIAKFGVDQALLADKGEIKDVVVNKLIHLTDNYTHDKRVLLNSIVKALDCRVVFIRTRRPGTAQSYNIAAHVFAYESDLARIEFLFDMLQPQMLVGAAVAQVPNWENARSFRKSWMSGFTTAIAERLKRTQKEAVVEAGAGTDVVLFDRSRAVEFDFNLTYNPKHIVSGGARKLAGSGRSQGYAAGRKANLGNAVNGGRKALAG